MIKNKNRITNPIYIELKKLKLIKDKNLFVLNKKTRDRKIRVIKDSKTKVIFLEKYLTRINHYSSLKNYDEFKIGKAKIKKIKTTSGYIKTNIIINEDLRRYELFKKELTNKHILDFGCGWGGLMKNIKKYKSLCGVEVREQCISYIKKKIKKINIYNNINLVKNKVDIITMFHVLEHLPNQVDTLKSLKSKLRRGGKIIIEVPHAQDFLILQNNLKEFKNFTFWSEHLILHTQKSLRKILTKSGFRNIKFQYYQRYGFANHLGWFIERKPSMGKIYNNIFNKKLQKAYVENLKQLGQTDTLLVVATNPSKNK